MGGVASGLWIGTNVYKTYDCRASEEKVKNDYLPIFHKLWSRFERRCYRQYLEEAADSKDDKDHVYHSLKYSVNRCRDSIRQNATVQNVGDCHYRVRELVDVCLYYDLSDPLEYDDKMAYTGIGELLKSGGYQFRPKG